MPITQSLPEVDSIGKDPNRKMPEIVLKPAVESHAKMPTLRRGLSRIVPSIRAVLAVIGHELGDFDDPEE